VEICAFRLDRLWGRDSRFESRVNFKLRVMVKTDIFLLSFRTCGCFDVLDSVRKEETTRGRRRDLLTSHKSQPRALNPCPPKQQPIPALTGRLGVRG